MYASWSLSGICKQGVLRVMVVVVHSKVKYSLQRQTSFDDAHYMCLMFSTAMRMCELAPFRAGGHCGLLVGDVQYLFVGQRLTSASKQGLLGQRWSTGHPNMLDSAECHAAGMAIIDLSV